MNKLLNTWFTHKVGMLSISLAVKFLKVYFWHCNKFQEWTKDTEKPIGYTKFELELIKFIRATEEMGDNKHSEVE